MSLSKIHSKNSITPINGRTGNKRKYHKTHHFIDVGDLTNMFMPLYEYTWKGAGHNNCVWHTMKDFTGLTIASKGLEAKGGDFTAIQCLPGRQCYMEFSALPLSNPFTLIASAGAGAHANTTANSNGYRSYNAALLELAERCTMHNNFFPNASVGNQYSTENVKAGDIAAGWLTNLFNSNTTGTKFATDNANMFIMTKMLDLEFIYEGGVQVHKLTNTTSLPVYLEIREFMPRNAMAFTTMYGNFDVVGVVGNAYKFPGLHETIYLDKLRQWQKQNGFSATDYPDSGSLFDDLDDKQFKYNKFMKISNQRWVIGDAMYHRILPGETFTYTMELPPFKLKFSELFEYNAAYSDAGASGNVISFFNGNVATGSPNYPSFFPKFSKFVSIRATGSTAWTQGAPGFGVASIGQKDGMEDQLGKTMGFTENDADNTLANRFSAAGVKTATHAVQLLHFMSEKHSCRMKPVCCGYHKEALDFMPNARTTNAILAGDNMGFYDESLGAMDVVSGDNV